MTFINAQKVERYFRLLILTNYQLSEKHSYRSFSHRNELIFLLIIKQKGILCNNYFLTSDFPLAKLTKPCPPILPICDFRRGVLNARLRARIQHLLSGHKYGLFYLLRAVLWLEK